MGGALGDASALSKARWFVSETVVAVTGTNGKTTTTTLISRILERNGREVFTGGNIGTPTFSSRAARPISSRRR